MKFGEAYRQKKSAKENLKRLFVKILSISSIPLLPHLGSGQTRLHWTSGLQSLGHTVDILQPKDFELFGSFKKAKQYRMALGILLRVQKQLRKSSYDLIEFYGSEYWLLLLWFKKFKKRIPLLVAHADGVELNDMDKAQLFWDKRKGLHKWVYDNTHYRFAKINFALANRLVCGCADDLTYMIRRKYFLPEQAKSIPPGIDDSFHEISFQPEKEKIIIFIGSWIERKGMRIVPDVINQILSHHTAYKFYIIGAGINKEDVLKTFDVSLQNRVIVFGKISLKELQVHTQAAGIFFFPSYSEGFGLSVIEAMSCSCAVVTTPTGVGNELVNNEEAIVCNFDDVTAMINSIEYFIANETERKRIAFKGWQKAKEYRWDKQVKQLETTYENWCHQS